MNSDAEKHSSEMGSIESNKQALKWGMITSFLNNPLLYGSAVLAIVYTVNGLQPVVSRYLQTISKVPSMSLNAFANFVSFIALTPLIMAHYSVSKCKNPKSNKEVPPNTNEHHNGNTFLIVLVTGLTMTLFMVFRFVKSFSNLLGSRYTSAINNQLVSLTCPILVSLLNGLIILIKKWKYPQIQEKINKATYFSWTMFGFMCITIFGGMLIALGTQSINKDGSFSYTIKWSEIFKQQSDSNTNLIGIGYANLANFMGAFYTILCSFVLSNDEEVSNSISKYNRFRMSSTRLMYFQSFILSVSFAGFSLAMGEDWSIYLQLGSKGWGFVMVYTIIGYLIADTLTIFSVAICGSTNATALGATSLIATIFFSWILLNEIVTNLWQIIGIVVVFVGVIGFTFGRRGIKTEVKEDSESLKENDELQQKEIELENV